MRYIDLESPPNAIAREEDALLGQDMIGAGTDVRGWVEGRIIGRSMTKTRWVPPTTSSFVQPLTGDLVTEPVPGYYAAVTWPVVGAAVGIARGVGRPVQQWTQTDSEGQYRFRDNLARGVSEIVVGTRSGPKRFKIIVGEDITTRNFTFDYP